MRIIFLGLLLSALSIYAQNYPILQNLDNIEIENLGPIVNTDAIEYAPTITGDGKLLYFVSNREGSIINKERELSHDIWYVNLENGEVVGQPQNIPQSLDEEFYNINTSFNEGAACISSKGTMIFFTACSRPNGLGECDIYFSRLVDGFWEPPYLLDGTINSAGWDTQPTMTIDGSKVYFVSSRKGPNSDGRSKPENIDIWYCEWDEDIQYWGPAKNLKEINTDEQEFSPFITPDGKTLIFASKGYNSKKYGLDFFMTNYDESTGKWSKPKSLGDKINTKKDEMFITMPESGDVLYFSSERKDIKGNQGGLDLYRVKIKSE